MFFLFLEVLKVQCLERKTFGFQTVRKPDIFRVHGRRTFKIKKKKFKKKFQILFSRFLFLLFVWSKNFRHQICVQGPYLMRIDNLYLVGKMFKNISPDSVRSGRTCPANLSVRSCQVLSGQEAHMPSLVVPYFKVHKKV